MLKDESKLAQASLRNVTIKKNLLILHSPYDATLVTAIKAIPGRRWDSDTKTWRIPASKPNAVIALAELIATWNFEVSEKAKAIFDNVESVEPQPDKVLSLKGGRFIFTFDYNKVIMEQIKDIAGRKFDKKPEPHWSVPISSKTTPAVMKIADRFEFYITQGVNEAAQGIIEAAQENIVGSRADDATIEVSGLGGELRPFQKAGVAYAARVKRTFIADEMGLGKTIEALATIQATNAYPALIVCPASVKLNWQREAEKWLPGRLVSVINGIKGAVSADVVIINYNVLGRNKKRLMGAGFESVVLDESQYIKNSKAATTKHAHEIGNEARIRLCLTGTPVVNRPNELITQLEFLDRLDDLGGFWEFVNRYCNAHRGNFGWDFSGASNLDEMNDKLRASCYIRRQKAEVSPELPAKSRTVIPVEIDNRTEYNGVHKEIEAWIKERAAQDREFEKSIATLPPTEKVQAIEERGTTAEERARNAEKLVLIGRLKQSAARGKLSAIKEWVTNFLETGEKLVLFAHHTAIIDLLVAEFDAPAITGKTPIAKRQAAIDAFQNDPAVRLIILNIKAGGVGITLTASSKVAFCEQDWTPASHDQCEARVDRIGQENTVMVYYFIAVDTIDPDIYELIDNKRGVVNAATEGGEVDSGSVFSEAWKALEKSTLKS